MIFREASGLVPVGAGGDRSDQATGGRSRERRCDVGVTESCTWLLRNKGTVGRSPELGVKLNPTELSCVGPLRVQFSVLEFGL